MREDPITHYNGMYSVMLRSCTAAVLAHILDPAIPVIWVRRHMPQRYIQWWQAQAPLSVRGGIHELEVRAMEFDLQLPTSRFLELLAEFEDHGIVLFQMTRRVPDTLTLDRVAEDLMNRVLLQNGLHLGFYLPHAGESAQLSSPHREVLERALEQTAVRELVY